MKLADDPREVLNPIHIDTVVEGSVTVLTSPDVPGKIIVKAQVTMPPETSPKTLLLHLGLSDAHQLHTALSACLAGTSN